MDGTGGDGEEYGEWDADGCIDEGVPAEDAYNGTREFEAGDEPYASTGLEDTSNDSAMALAISSSSRLLAASASRVDCSKAARIA